MEKRYIFKIKIELYELYAMYVYVYAYYNMANFGSKILIFLMKVVVVYSTWRVELSKLLGPDCTVH